jgi:putative ABC transport system substrate-binding protein
MRWRECIAFVGVAILTLAAQPGSAQPSNTPGKVFRLGVLSPDPGFIERLRIDAIRELARQGFVEGSNLIVDFRAGTTQMLAALASELIAAKPDAIIANTALAIRAVRSRSDKVPIVAWFIGEDPIAAGYAISLARPGRNVTGVVMLAPELGAKRLEALLEAVPNARRVATLQRALI